MLLELLLLLGDKIFVRLHQVVPSSVNSPTGILPNRHHCAAQPGAVNTACAQQADQGEGA